MPVTEMNERLGAALVDISDDELAGNLMVIEPGKVRIRRSQG